MLHSFEVYLHSSGLLLLAVCTCLSSFARAQELSSFPAGIQLNEQLAALRSQHGRTADAELEEAYLKLTQRFTKPQHRGLIYTRLSEMYCFGPPDISAPERADKAIAFARRAREFPLDLETRLKVDLQEGTAMQRATSGFERTEIAQLYLQGLKAAMDEGVPNRRIPVPLVSKFDIDVNPEDPGSVARARSWQAAHEAAVGAMLQAEALNKSVSARAGLERQLLNLYLLDDEQKSRDELYALALEILGTEERALALFEKLREAPDVVQVIK